MTQQTGRKSRLGDAGDTMRLMLFNSVLTVGTLFLDDFRILPRKEARLVSLVIAAFLLLVIPSKNPIQARPMIFNLIALATGYYILVKLHPWLAQLTNPMLATIISVTLILSLAFTFLTFFGPRVTSRPTSD